MKCPRRQGKQCRKVPADLRCSTLCPRIVKTRLPEMPARFHLKYIMVGPARTIVALDTSKTRELIRWAKWFETADRKIGRTEIGDCVVSTVFLGMDHGFYDEGPPILFETMVFACSEDYGSDNARIVEHVRKHAAEADGDPPALPRALHSAPCSSTAERIIKHLCARRPEEC